MVEDTDEQLIFFKDRDAKTGHKSAGSSFFGYKTHLAMSEERIITAAVVTSGEKRRFRIAKITANKPGQRDGSRCHYWRCGLYSGKENLKIASEQNIKIV